MDWSHFGMDRAPFRPAVDTSAYFAGPTHEAALHALVAAFSRRDPVVLIDGPFGAGKSLVARKWLDDLLPDVPRVLIPNARATKPADLLQAILFDLGKPYEGLTEQELRLAVTGHLLDAAATGFPTVFVIDEAQHLAQPALEELRLLGNLESRNGAVTFTVLVAQPALRESLQRPSHASFADRVAVRQALAPLTAEESTAYLAHQVRAAGGDPAKVFDEDSLPLLSSACAGLPRTLNRAAALAFELSAAAGAFVVDVEAALEALERLGLTPPDEGGSGEAVLLPHPARGPETRKTKPPAASQAGERGAKAKPTRKRTA